MFAPLSAESARALETLTACIEQTFPVPARFAIKLPSEIAALSRLFTSARSERDEGYLSRAGYRNAYLRYFLPWNVYRLCRLFEGQGGGLPPEAVPHWGTASGDSPELALPDGAVCVDLGAGTLALPIALWISFPALRSKRLTIYCVDKNAAALSAGLSLFNAFTAQTAGKSGGGCRWHIVTVRADFTRFKLAEKAAFVSSFNVFNEIYATVKQGDVAALSGLAAKTARTVARLLAPGGLLLAAEPGIPSAGQFISLFRAALLNEGFSILLPCTHQQDCAMHGGRRGKKWCHFVFDTAAVPKALNALSVQARLPKEKATLSLLFARRHERPPAPLPPEAGGTDERGTGDESGGMKRERGTGDKGGGMKGGRGAGDKGGGMKGERGAGDKGGGMKGERGAEMLVLRVLSAPIKLPLGQYGLYACSAAGLVLLYGSRHDVESIPFGAHLVRARPHQMQYDKKSGALMCPV